MQLGKGKSHLLKAFYPCHGDPFAIFKTSIMNKKQCINRIPALLLLLVALNGCMPGLPSVPGRKKLPADEKKFLVQLADPANDSATINLINTYRPIAIPFLAEWAKENRGGVTIDLRAAEGGNRLYAHYLLQKEGYFNIPVELIWDSQSASRAARFLEFANGCSEVNILNAGQDAGEIGLNCSYPGPNF